MENTMPVHVSDFNKVCRTCLSTQKLQPIYDLKFNETLILSLFDSCATVHVEENDDLPQNLCSECLQEIIRIHIFQEKCKQTENLLRTALTQPQILKQDVEEEIILKFETHSNYSSDSETETKKPVRKKINSFSCRPCRLDFTTKDELKEHRKKHPEVRNHTCTICSKMFTSSKLRQHMRVHTKEKPYVCSVCSKGFTMSGNLKRHMMGHTGERPHVCEFCGKGFIQATSLQAHHKTHSTNYQRQQRIYRYDRIDCNVCGKMFKRLNAYNAHLRKHCTNDSNDIDNNSDAVKTALKQLIMNQDEQEERKFVCEICKRAYKTKHLLKTHSLSHGEKSFLCSECGKGFITNAALQSHLRVHTGEKPYSCNVCKKTFAHPGTFDSHMLIHTGQKPHRCKVCGKAFTQLTHVKYHMRTHSGERPYSCTYCGKSFALKGNLTVHIRTHTGETPYICAVCGKGFYDSSSMKKHQRGHAVVNVATAGEASGVHKFEMNL